MADISVRTSVASGGGPLSGFGPEHALSARNKGSVVIDAAST
jgi:hypothetical protein